MTKIIIGSLSFFAMMILIMFFFVKLNPYMKEKYSSATFAHMDKIGILDEIENLGKIVFNAFIRAKMKCT